MASNCPRIRVVILDDYALVWRDSGVFFGLKSDVAEGTRFGRPHDLCTWIKTSSTRSRSSKPAPDSIDDVPGRGNGRVQLTRDLSPQPDPQLFFQCRLDENRVAHVRVKFPRDPEAIIKHERDVSRQFGRQGNAERLPAQALLADS